MPPNFKKFGNNDQAQAAYYTFKTIDFLQHITTGNLKKWQGINMWMTTAIR